MSPRPERALATRCGVLINRGVQVFPESSGRDPGAAGERRDNGLDGYKDTLAHRNQLANRLPLRVTVKDVPLSSARMMRPL